jgi:hypothetical protein
MTNRSPPLGCSAVTGQKRDALELMASGPFSSFSGFANNARKNKRR